MRLKLPKSSRTKERTGHGRNDQNHLKLKERQDVLPVKEITYN